MKEIKVCKVANIKKTYDKKYKEIEFSKKEKMIINTEKIASIEKIGMVFFRITKNNEKQMVEPIICNFSSDQSFEEKDCNNALKIHKFMSLYDDIRYNEISYHKKDFKFLHSYNNDIITTLNENYETISFNGEVQDKIVVGLGGHSVFENDITLHHTYGIPYIPGQALKGVVRNFIINEEFQGCEKRALNDTNFCLLFGNEDHQGKVIYLDAFPDNNVTMVKDVMTPHHKGYYNNNKSPLDTERPIPVSFYVLKNPSFKIQIAINKEVANLFWGKIMLKDYLQEKLQEALYFSGIGSKTSVGYGFFNIEE